MKRIYLLATALLTAALAMGQGEFDPSSNQFRQLRNTLATPNVYRNAAGAPGHQYWQQRADYDMEVTLDDENQRLEGRETITYYNNSPDKLAYLWVQLDQNRRMPNSLTMQTMPVSLNERLPSQYLRYFHSDFEGGFHITEVSDARGNALSHTINYTMMRVDLPEALEPGDRYTFRIKWWYNINDRQKDGGGRSGMEYFEKDDNYLYTLAQFYPRMAVYNEVEGWQNKQFLGRTEFALPFGTFDVKITVPEDHIVGATGTIQNLEEVLSDPHLERYRKAREAFDDPVVIVSEEEAREAIKKKARGTRTWHFRAENVRDFAIASSRRFLWDAMGVRFGDRTVMAMSLYPPEGNPLWEKYSTRVVAHTLQVYSRHTFDYPYPVAYSVHTQRIGMEYPMVAFNGGRPEPDGTYSERTKWGMIGVVIHEVGHNFFPMIVNSDERQWTWMDEGLNTFLQGVAEREWDHDHPYPRGKPADITDYMSGDQSNIAPIMINGELTMHFNANAYAKPATGLIILRESVMGRELFDYAFRQYAQRWKFKHPAPADFFRTMEDASAVDLDWFWRGWFYETDPVDISIEGVKVFTAGSGDPADKKSYEREKEEAEPEELTVQRNRKVLQSMVERDPSMKDFYDDYNPYAASPDDAKVYEQYRASLDEEERAFLDEEHYLCQVDLENIGGMVMPLVLQFTFTDGSTEIKRVPAEIWSRNNLKTSKVFVFDKEVESVLFDPYEELADCDTENNHWPRKVTRTRFELYKYNRNRSRTNPMQQEK